MNDFFDETKIIWLRIYKMYTIVMFFLTLIVTIIIAIGDGLDSGGIFNVNIANGGFTDFIVWILIGSIGTFFNLVANMIWLNFFNNVRVIQEIVYRNLK
jgi:hypothetical protein